MIASTNSKLPNKNIVEAKLEGLGVQSPPDVDIEDIESFHSNRKLKSRLFTDPHINLPNSP